MYMITLNYLQLVCIDVEPSQLANLLCKMIQPKDQVQTYTPAQTVKPNGEEIDKQESTLQPEQINSLVQEYAENLDHLKKVSNEIEFNSDTVRNARVQKF